jgi:hypothetical protein
MVKLPYKEILFSLIALTFVLTLTLPSTMLNGFSQLQIPDFKSKSIEDPTADPTASIQSSVNIPEPPAEQIAMKIQFEEHENEILADSGYLQVSDFAFSTSNNSKLCPAGACEYELDDGQSHEGSSTGDRYLTGKFKVDTGESKKIMNLRGDWEAIEERETPEGETIFVIEGDLGMGKNQFSPENEYLINGTLTSNDDGYLLEATGFRG